MEITIPWLTVVIPTFGKVGVGLVNECLRSMAETHPGLHIQKIVVDDGSGEAVVNELAQVCVSHDAMLVARVENGGFAKTCNDGVAHSNGLMTFLVNNDIVFANNPCLQIMADTAQAIGAGVIGTRLLYPNGTVQHGGVVFVPVEGQEILGYWDHFGRGLPAWKPEVVTLRPSLVTGALFGISRGAINALGFLDERFGMAAEDIDYCLECITAGMPVYYQGQCWAYHAEGVTRGNTPESKAERAPEAWEKEKRGLKSLFSKWQGVDMRQFAQVVT